MADNAGAKSDRKNSKYDWCCTEWYDGPLRAFAIVPDYDSLADNPLIEVRTNLAWADENGDHHMRFDREELQTMLDMIDGKPVRGFHDHERVYKSS